MPAYYRTGIVGAEVILLDGRGRPVDPDPVLASGPTSPVAVPSPVPGDEPAPLPAPVASAASTTEQARVAQNVYEKLTGRS